MTILESAVRNLLAQYPDILYGFADISYSPLAQEYPSALVLAVPHGKQLTPGSYTEPDFDAAICSSRDRLEAFLEKLEALLKEQKVVYYIPPMARRMKPTFWRNSLTNMRQPVPASVGSAGTM